MQQCIVGILLSYGYYKSTFFDRFCCSHLEIFIPVNDEEGLETVQQELEAKAVAPFTIDRQMHQAPAANRGAYSQVAFAYEGDNKEDNNYVVSEDDDDEEDDDKDTTSDDSEDDEIETIAREYGVKRFRWLVHMDRKAKEEERRQKEVVKGDPAMRKLSRKERRRVSQQEREREREVTRMGGSRSSYRDPYREPRRSPTYEAYPRYRMRSRSRSRSRSPSYSRRYDRDWDENSRRRSKGRDTTSKIEYITEFGITTNGEDIKSEAVSPPPSPPSQADVVNRSEHCTFKIWNNNIASILLCCRLFFSFQALFKEGNWVMLL
eukprot:TRINITY_DN184_c0_g1_i1.p1 TRINITY_DN184_c0_g1~~TRINITY_DN184_c0_g1_i1.p1  ORF type:complete len:320 (-),score=65.87 TRINITY_DN184_c0_g1_i1:1013-1972(-)